MTPLFKSLKDTGLFPYEFTILQTDSINALYNCYKESGDGDLRKFAYVLATAYHEAARTNPLKPNQRERIVPVPEIGKGKAKPYGVPDPITKKIYYGRGFVQLTWKANYEIAGKLIGVDLVNNPDYLLNNVEDGAKVAVVGMYKGMFTGVGLGKYFTQNKQDWINARRIINGIDRAKDIAEYAIKIYNALKQNNVS